MAEFMVQLPHTMQDCREIQENFSEKNRSILSKFRWGCMAGEHNAWAFIQADSESEVRNMLPEGLRQKAKITKVKEMTLEQIKSMHAEKAGVR